MSAAEVLRAWWSMLDEQFREPDSSTPWTKPDLKDAVEATDAWVDANQASYVSYLNTNAPAFGGANSTASQKTLLFCYTLLVRQGLR